MRDLHSLELTATYEFVYGTLMRNLLPVLCLALLLPTSSALAKDDLTTKVENSTTVLLNLLGSDPGPPASLLTESSCIIVIPRVIEGAFVIGGKHGRGVLSCRKAETGGWSYPVFVELSGGSIGFQIGGRSTDLVILIKDRNSIDSLLRSKFTVGVDAGVAAGPHSAKADAYTDVRFDAEMYSYATSNGLFAGAAIDGARLSLERKSIPKFYRTYVRVEDILFGNAEIVISAAAEAFRVSLPD